MKYFYHHQVIVNKTSTKLKLLFLIILILQFFTRIYAQTENGFLLPENRLKFGDFLFCEADYLRAIDEYKAYQNHFMNDTVQFKIALCFSSMKRFSEARKYFYRFNEKSHLVNKADHFYLSSFFLEGKYNNYITEYQTMYSGISSNTQIEQQLAIAKLMSDDFSSYTKSEIIKPFENENRFEVSSLYEDKVNPKYKSEVAAAMLSAVIPGAGKIYTGNTGDGITALLITGLFTYLAVDNFQKDRETRAYIFTGLAAFFYAGNVYGSAASAQLYNAGIRFDFNNQLNLFLGKNNHFLPVIDFICP